ncbi:hypothetical protein SAMN04487904_107175 [Actinopolyspora lacussalsi subsp. righensis]|uniref:Uncharacterized protein n=1 Tax=Actinopolyspora righensis TaxID=995060 RepID=A0A1I7AL55_9ACTN|nr:hypothetical protein [Actinopolyspora righensis]SFT75585.1 hypothetical protein SAMN04487904_107175 [Actinopolyspora righensis]
MYLDRPQIKEWMQEHDVIALDERVSGRFENYLNSFPWAGSHVDWRVVENEKLCHPDDVDDHFLEKCRGTPWGSFGHVLVVYTGDEPSLLCELEDVAEDIDLLYCVSPGDRFSCAASLDGDVVRVYFSNFLEYDGHVRMLAAKNTKEYFEEFDLREHSIELDG